MTGERVAGKIIELHVFVDVVASVREVRWLREAVGGKINVEIDDGEGLLRAWRDE